MIEVPGRAGPRRGRLMREEDEEDNDEEKKRNMEAKKQRPACFYTYKEASAEPSRRKDRRMRRDRNHINLQILRRM